MASILLLALSLLLISAASAAAVNSAPTCSPPDLAALQAFAASFNSSLTRPFFLSAWRPHLDCCTWVGVRCAMMMSSSSTNTSRVVALSLPHTNLRGPIPHALCGLAALSSLNLSANSIWLSGPIPSCIGHNLIRLQTLDLSSNLMISGSLSPQLLNFPHLTHLDLSGNSFSGALPIFNSTPSLQYLDLSFNSFSGSVSPLINLSHLTHLDLFSNSFSGRLPILNTPRLQYLEVSSNSFSGSLPILNTPRLQYLDVSYNFFSRNLPPFNTTLHLQQLHLSRNGWEGDIPSLAHLPNLEELLLSETSLAARASSIAQLFCDLTSLKRLILSRRSTSAGWFTSKLDQSPPQCERPSVNLTHLDLSINFYGPLPPWMAMFPKLQSLSLSANNLSGSNILIPQEWQALTHLTSLDLISNSDSPSSTSPVYLSHEPIQAWLFRLPLDALTLRSMGLTTQHFPACELGLSLLNQTLGWLDLSQNHLSQSLWNCLALHNFTRLSGLSLSNNPLNFNLALSHPLSLGRHSILDLSYCQLFGDLRIEILLLASFIHLAHNDLAGRTPASQIGSNLASQTLQWLDLSFNNLTGPIPTNSILGNLSSAFAIILNNNHLDGEISLQDLMGSESQLGYLQLANNSFTKLASLGNMSVSNLQILDLSFNKLQGDLQELLIGDLYCSNTVLSSLRVLLLGHNQLSGSIPASFCWESSPSLVEMDLSNNKLTGAIPESLKLLPCLRLIGSSFIESPIELKYSLERVKNVKYFGGGSERLRGHLDLSSNMLSGPIPEELGELRGLNDLNLSNNLHLSGPIPASLANLSQLESLDLSYNNLQGSIPTALSQLSNLAVFNVSFNPELRGPIPQGSPQLENEDSYKGDPNLCGEIIRKECIDVTTTNYVPAASSTSELDRGRLHNVLQWIEEWISIPGICLGYPLGFALTICFLKLIHFYG